MRTALLLTLVVPLLLAPATARADDSVARAKERFTRAAQAYREARYTDAIELFLQANQLDPHPIIVLSRPAPGSTSRVTSIYRFAS